MYAIKLAPLKHHICEQGVTYLCIRTSRHAIEPLAEVFNTSIKQDHLLLPVLTTLQHLIEKCLVAKQTRTYSTNIFLFMLL